MKVQEFDFDLPQELIAQTPLEKREQSRLLHLERQTGHVTHHRFTGIDHFLQAGDVLVVNDTRVLPARLLGVKKDTGAKVEMLLLHRQKNDEWQTLVKPGKKVQEGTVIEFGGGLLQAVCLGRTDAGGRLVRMLYKGVFEEILSRLGEMPLPPYIKEKLSESERYQTVYAKHPGSAAAPTAGLHFTEELLETLRSQGVRTASITLHVGLGTFRPVQAERVQDHDMHAEFYRMDVSTAALLNEAKREGRRIISVGTTSTRTLETIMRDHERFIETSGWTDIFIYPGFRFAAIDGLITNFHLPQSTLLMLVSAFAGKEQILNAYNEAIQKKYRFFSFGDAMLIL